MKKFLTTSRKHAKGNSDQKTPSNMVKNMLTTKVIFA